MSAPEATHEGSAFWDEVSRLMDERGIESLEDLHRRFLESSVRGFIPVSGRHRDKPVSLSEFREHITARHRVVYGELIVGLADAFELDPESEEVSALGYSYAFGRPGFGVHPTTPLP
jgi:hypothetical protein